MMSYNIQELYGSCGLNSEKNYFQLETRALHIRRKLLRMFEGGIVGHLGGSGSLVEIITYLYFKEMDISKEQILNSTDRDILILSKGHSVLVQYAALSEMKILPENALGQLKEVGGILQGHPDMRKTPGIEANTGSLGQGLSISLGLALAFQLKGSDKHIYTILGDGELAEGQVWEAAMATSRYGIDSITAIIDRNRYQATGSTKDRYPIVDLEAKWKAFGWHVVNADGHDFKSLDRAFEEVRGEKGGPSVIIANTVKGKGFAFAENTHKYHNCSLSNDEMAMAIENLYKKAK